MSCKSLVEIIHELTLGEAISPTREVISWVEEQIGKYNIPEDEIKKFIERTPRIYGGLAGALAAKYFPNNTDIPYYGSGSSVRLLGAYRKFGGNSFSSAKNCFVYGEFDQGSFFEAEGVRAVGTFHGGCFWAARGSWASGKFGTVSFTAAEHCLFFGIKIESVINPGESIIVARKIDRIENEKALIFVCDYKGKFGENIVKITREDIGRENWNAIRGNFPKKFDKILTKYGKEPKWFYEEYKV